MFPPLDPNGIEGITGVRNDPMSVLYRTDVRLSRVFFIHFKGLPQSSGQAPLYHFSIQYRLVSEKMAKRAAVLIFITATQLSRAFNLGMSQLHH